MWGNGTISLSVRVGNTVFFLFAIGRGRRNGRRWRVWRWAREISRRCGNVVVFFPLRRGAKEGKVSRFVLCIFEERNLNISSEQFYLAIVIFISSDLSFAQI